MTKIALIFSLFLFVLLPAHASEQGLGLPETSGNQESLLDQISADEENSDTSALLENNQIDNSETSGSIIEDAMTQDGDEDNLGIMDQVDTSDQEDQTSIVEAADGDLPSPTEAFLNLYKILYLALGLFLLFPIIALLMALFSKAKEVSQNAKEELVEDFEEHPEDPNNHELKDPEAIVEDGKKAIDDLPK